MDAIDLINEIHGSKERLIKDAKELDKAIGHILQLIEDSYALYSRKSYSTSAFLSVTVCEEVAKAHIGNFSDGIHAKKNKSLFFDHKTKHLLAALPTVSMGSRLQDSIGKKELKRIMNMAQNSGLVQKREEALYFQREKDKLITPSDKIDKNTSKSLLLFCIEVFDDALVGFTDYSFIASKVTDKLFGEVKNMK